MSLVNRQILLVERPKGEPTESNFKLVSTPVPALGPGQVLVRHQYLSLDPYMRGRMNDAKSYAEPQPLNAVMLGGTVGEVVDSKNEHFKPGDIVQGMGGWQEYAVVDANQRGVLRKIDTRHIPASAYLGVVGMPGITAWYGLRKIIDPKPGQTVVVSAAAGAVGGVVGQLAKLSGCRAVGFAGGPEKTAYVVNELGFDACIDYKQHRDLRALSAALREAAPNGIDGNFENVGGTILDAVMLQMNPFGRIAMCGLIAGYNGEPTPMLYPVTILSARLKIEGFIVSEHMEVWPEAMAELGKLVAEGKLKYRETIAEGIESAPSAFLGMLKGKNFGKQLVKLY
jgi:NADPH-dependent curcumin reductase CurA